MHVDTICLFCGRVSLCNSPGCPGLTLYTRRASNSRDSLASVSQVHLYAWWILFFIELNGSLTLRDVYMCDVVYVCSYLCMCDCLHILYLCMNIYAYVYK